MKYIVLLLVAFSVNASEKTTDTKNTTMSPSAISATMPGNLDGTNTFDRRYSNGFDSGCNYTSIDSSNNGVSYQTFEIHSPSGQNADIEITTPAGSTLTDTLLFVYCSFDPANPANNLAGIDDDDGVNFLSKIVPTDGLTMTAGTSYFVVVAGFSAGQQGVYDLVLGGDLQFGPAAVLAPPANVPALNNMTLVLLLLSLIVMASLYIRKKQKG